MHNHTPLPTVNGTVILAKLLGGDRIVILTRRGNMWQDKQGTLYINDTIDEWVPNPKWNIL